MQEPESFKELEEERIHKIQCVCLSLLTAYVFSHTQLNPPAFFLTPYRFIRQYELFLSTRLQTDLENVTKAQSTIASEIEKQ